MHGTEFERYFKRKNIEIGVTVHYVFVCIFTMVKVAFWNEFSLLITMNTTVFEALLLVEAEWLYELEKFIQLLVLVSESFQNERDHQFCHFKSLRSSKIVEIVRFILFTGKCFPLFH